MRKASVLAVIVYAMTSANFASADTFSTGRDTFTVDFVTISGSSNPAFGYGIVANDYRMGKYEITNAQWMKFKSNYGTPSGFPVNAYDQEPYYTGQQVPTNNVSWYEAAQFVNYLNTSKGYQAAYKFTFITDQGGMKLDTWSAAEAAGGTNLYRNKNAKYYLPTENEWVKAAYWNGTNLQTYATKASESLTQGNGTSGTGWNYYDNRYAIQPYGGPWNVGSGSQELNGTYDMMGNVWEWMESPYTVRNYLSDANRGLRGGSYGNADIGTLASPNRYGGDLPDSERIYAGFRVASVPEPCSLVLLSLEKLILRCRKNKRLY
jgi:formylglycine-generating enzyme required for sulfatase activity